MADEFVTVRAEMDVDGEPYRVLSCFVREAIFEVPQAMCEVTVPDSALSAGPPDPGTLIGKPAKIKMFRSDGSVTREFAGIVIQADRAGDADGRPVARLRVAPKLWKLGKRADCRTFQKKSVPDIVAEVLTGGGVVDQENKIAGSYDPRDYCVQYRETDLDFVLRLCSEEGIYLTVRFEEGKDIVVLADDPTGVGDIEGTTELPFHTTQGFTTSREQVMWVKQAHSVQSDKVFVRDYDFERPKFKLEAEVEGKDPGAHALEVYTFPGRFVDQAVGKRYAEVLLDSIQAKRDVVSGETTVLTMQPGKRFSIVDHPYEPLNQEYLITSVDTEVREGFSATLSTMGETPKPPAQPAAGQRGRDYLCRFEAVPTARTAYRPPRKARARSIPGAQTAVTTGPSGSEIHSDAHGRVKARYMWDRLGKEDDTSSLWMRTSQMATGGSMLLPRVGWEVSVRHVEGDPDVPLVMNRLYNAVKPPPYALPGGKARGAMQTATTPGGGSSNEFRMDDSKGKEEMMFNASKDMTVDVVNNETESVGNNETHTVGSNQKINVTNSFNESVGGSQSTSVGGDQTVHVETFMVDQIGGDHTLSIGGDRDMKIGGDHKRTVGGDSSIDVGSMQVDLVVGSVSANVSGDMTHDVGTAVAEITTSDRTFTVGGDRTETTALAKAVISMGGRGVEVGGSMTQKVAGAIIAKIDADRSDEAGATFTEVAAGAHILKCDKAVFEGEGIVSFVMGASTITLTPASISIAGISIKIDGATADTAALIINN